MPNAFLDEHVLDGGEDGGDGDARVLLIHPLRRPGAATAVAEVQTIRARVDAPNGDHLDSVSGDVLKGTVHLRVQVRQLSSMSLTSSIE